MCFVIKISYYRFIKYISDDNADFKYSVGNKAMAKSFVLSVILCRRDNKTFCTERFYFLHQT